MCACVCQCVVSLFALGVLTALIAVCDVVLVVLQAFQGLIYNTLAISAIWRHGDIELAEELTRYAQCFLETLVDLSNHLEFSPLMLKTHILLHLGEYLAQFGRASDYSTGACQCCVAEA